MQLDNINLETWFENAPADKFYNSKKIDYYGYYNTFKAEAEKYHKEVVALANYREALDGNIVFLNDHGKDHIETVINRASDLVRSSVHCELTPKEVYYLLTAIHFHDVGNLYGRINHVDDMRHIADKLDPFIKLDTIEKRHIKDIAEAHGGKLPNGSKDKIGKLPIVANTLEGDVRIQLLAAILRLADELSDDKNRCCDIIVNDKEHFDNKSRAYHVYSSCLTCIAVEHSIKQIKLEFNIPLKFAQEKVRKDDTHVFVIDEIYERALKTLNELIYTMRFTRGLIDLTSIMVRIKFVPEYITLKPHEEPVLFKPHDDITFTLEEQGYPEYYADIYSACPTLVKKDQNGESISKKINDRIILPNNKKRWRLNKILLSTTHLMQFLQKM